jgi:hypothetical protein
VDVLGISAAVDDEDQQKVGPENPCRKEQDEERLRHVPQGDGHVTSRQVARVRAAAVVERWRREPRRLLFHAHTSTMYRSVTVRPQVSLTALRHVAIRLLHSDIKINSFIVIISDGERKHRIIQHNFTSHYILTHLKQITVCTI